LKTKPGYQFDQVTNLESRFSSPAFKTTPLSISPQNLADRFIWLDSESKIGWRFQTSTAQTQSLLVEEQTANRKHHRVNTES